MRKTRIVYIILTIFLFLSFSFVFGCTKKDEFVQVRSITYSIGNESTTIYSSSKKEYSSSETITKEEYYNAPSDQRFVRTLNEYTKLSPLFKFPAEHKGTNEILVKPAETNSQKLIHYFVNYNTLSGEPIYYKKKYLGIRYQYVSVKQLKDSSIIIKYRGKEIKCMANSFQINYF